MIEVGSRFKRDSVYCDRAANFFIIMLQCKATFRVKDGVVVRNMVRVRLWLTVQITLPNAMTQTH